MPQPPGGEGTAEYKLVWMQWFLFRVRVGTEVNRLTVNKWSPSFYRSEERKPEHTHTHMPLKSEEEGTNCGHIYKKTSTSSLKRRGFPLGVHALFLPPDTNK